MHILVACEYSGRVTQAFRDKGHAAYSVDLLPTEGNPAWHDQGDVFDVLEGGMYDMLVAFPPCTKLSNVGAAWWPTWQADGTQKEAIFFFLRLALASIPRIAIENPAGIMSTFWRKPDQYVQPWWFGDPWIKRTGLWLKNLPKLTPTAEVEPKGHWVDGGTMTKMKLPREAEGAYEGAENKGNLVRAHHRSRTFQGLADAMAEQWGIY